MFFFTSYCVNMRISLFHGRESFITSKEVHKYTSFNWLEMPRKFKIKNRARIIIRHNNCKVTCTTLFYYNIGN